MMSSPPLATLQAWFAAVTTNPRGVEAGIADAERGISLGADNELGLLRLVTKGPALSALDRLAIYHAGYHARLVECLLDDYPAVAHWLGEDEFAALARSYIFANPSRSPSLNRFGERFAEHCRGQPGTWGAFAADLARLEWAIVEAIHAPSPAPLDRSVIFGVPEDAWATTQLVPSPSLRLVRSEYPVNDYYVAFREGSDPDPPSRAASATAVLRKGQAVWRYDLPPRMADLLQELMRGTPLGVALGALEGRIHDHEGLLALRRQLSEWFATWVESSFFAGVRRT